jgi:peptidoglycan hydrolase-like protein with peptidoglycan-binding domain
MVALLCAASATEAAQPSGEVRKLQHALGVPADGVFGAQTERAVKRFQRRHRLGVDGIVGPSTRRALGLGSGQVLRRERSRRSRHSAARPSRGGGGVRELQRVLGVPTDGVFGPGTEAAVRRFQRRHGLVADGVVGPTTRRALGLGSGPMLKRRSGGGQAGGGSVLQQIVAAANVIATTPYKYGGGHQHWRDAGYDCSGSLSYALHGAGLLASPLDSTGFMHYGAPGRGRHITIYANPGHTYMLVDGRRYDTSALHETGSRWTSRSRSAKGYVVRHPPGL